MIHYNMDNPWLKDKQTYAYTIKLLQDLFAFGFLYEWRFFYNTVVNVYFDK